MMSERWEQLTFLGSISSVGASHVRTSAAPVAELASLPEPAPDSGSNSIASSASSRPSGSSSRMSRRGLGGGCPVCGTTCGLGATEPVPSRFLPQTSARRSSDDASSSWPTLMASDYDRGPSAPASRQGSPNLTDAVALWPTPTATPYGSTNNGTRDGSTKYATAGTPSLDTIAKLWPTATATDARGSRRLGYPDQGSNTTLTDATLGHHGEATGPGGTPGLALNPEFVESLMGFPAGWTETA